MYLGCTAANWLRNQFRGTKLKMRAEYIKDERNAAWELFDHDKFTVKQK